MVTFPLGLMLFAAVCFAAALFLAWYLTPPDSVKGTAPRKEVKPANEWDEEFLRAEAAKHSVDRIVPDKLYFKFSDKAAEQVKNGGLDGFTWHCTCKKMGHGLNLEQADRTFNKHAQDMREAALAQLGRFK